MEVESGVPSFGLDEEYVNAENTVFMGQPETIQIYVEGFLDKGFWFDIFSRFIPRDKISIDPISRSERSNGKGIIIEGIRSGRINLGANLLICLDSDYDYLAGLNSDIYNSDFCFQTYAYAIENYYFNPCAVQDICHSACNSFDYSDFDANLFNKSFVAWSRSFYDDFLRFVAGGASESAIIEPAIDALKNIVLDKSIMPADSWHVEDAPDNCQYKEMGLHRNNLFVFIRGHNLEEAVLSHAIAFCASLKSHEKDKILNGGGTDTSQLLMEYYNQATKKPEGNIRGRNITENIPMYQKIIQDVQGFVNQYH